VAENVTLIEEEILEGTTPVFTAVVRDEYGQPLGPGALDSLTLTYYCLTDPGKSVINGRDHQNVLNANGVTLDSQGQLTWTLSPEDTQVLNPLWPRQRNRAVFEWTWNGGAGNGKHVVDLIIRNLAHVP